MCPSDIFQLPVSKSGFGPEAEVFTAETQYPCSISIREKELVAEDVKIQILKDEDAVWSDYQEGQLLIGKKIKCRLAYSGETKKITIEVFHT